MNQKSLVRMVMYSLAVLMLVVNATGVAASSNQSGKVFTVSPSGGDDTANIQHAFDLAVAAGARSTVRLAAGNFRTRFIEVWNFDGSFIGAGQNLTIIDTFANQDCQAQVDHNRRPALFNFYGGNVRVSDLGFHITPTTPCEIFLYGGFTSGYLASWIDALVITPSPFVPENDCAAIQKERVSGSITRVTIRGEQGEDETGDASTLVDSNIGEGIVLGGSFPTRDLWATDCIYLMKYAQGTFSITNTTQYRTMWGYQMPLTYHSPVLFRGNSWEIGVMGAEFSDNSGSMIEISNNHLKRNFFSGIHIWHGGSAKIPYIETPAVYDIHDNDIEMYEAETWTSSGIVAWDNDNLGTSYYPSTGKTAVLSIHDNRIKLTPLINPLETDLVQGVWMEGVDDSLIANNKISGAGTAAIYTGSWGPSKRDLILGNDLRDFSSNASAPYKIVLEWGTEHYIVTGEPAANVANYGTNNLIAGTRFQTPRLFTPDKLETMKQMLKTAKFYKGGF